MDLDQGETITTDHDSDEADESFYLSRLMLTGEQRLSSPNFFSSGDLNDGFRGTGIINPKTGKVLTLNTIHRRNRFGETKVHAAVVQGDVQAVKDMIKVGASVNDVDYAGWTPLHEAVDRNNHTITEILLKAGARVNCRGYNGITPLHDAIQQHYYEIVDLLLKYGADPLLKCDGGKTPMNLTTDSSMYRLVEKYLPKAKRHPCTVVNLFTTYSAAVIGTKAAQNSKGSGDASEHESSQQPIETEPISGPSVGKPSCDPSKKLETYFKVESSPQTSTNALCPVRDKGRDFCSQVPLLVQELENQGSDSCLASDVESDVTVDYTEATSSSPEHWTLCATQDFSGS
ncbi:ankyrin repeat domain-containing protein 31 [Xyrauchen texanus]|uniref:ankyrin repeat domain-containing protein 31 n=1 Tax=Xyrauchen texanus TaxID=154827 RepID=UPI002241FC01|nr:ankyrin repeat domain-containing protein 31 [Xyrauchen texanus]